MLCSLSFCSLELRLFGPSGEVEEKIVSVLIICLPELSLSATVLKKLFMLAPLEAYE